MISVHFVQVDFANKYIGGGVIGEVRCDWWPKLLATYLKTFKETSTLGTCCR